MQKCCVATLIYECDHPAPLEPFPLSVAEPEIFSHRHATAENLSHGSVLAPGLRPARIRGQNVLAATTTPPL